MLCKGELALQPIQNATVSPLSRVTRPATGDGGSPTGGNSLEVTADRFGVTVYKRVLPKFAVQVVVLGKVG